jgi:hypothetical protein
MIKFIIKEQIMFGEIYYNIYIRFIWFIDVFYERWNTYESANIRLNELNKTSI